MLCFLLPSHLHMPNVTGGVLRTHLRYQLLALLVASQSLSILQATLSPRSDGALRCECTLPGTPAAFESDHWSIWQFCWLNPVDLSTLRPDQPNFCSRLCEANYQLPDAFPGSQQGSSDVGPTPPQFSLGLCRVRLTCSPLVVVGIQSSHKLIMHL